jgi:hypothetical protein
MPGRLGCAIAGFRLELKKRGSVLSPWIAEAITRHKVSEAPVLVHQANPVGVAARTRTRPARDEASGTST